MRLIDLAALQIDHSQRSLLGVDGGFKNRRYAFQCVGDAMSVMAVNYFVASHYFPSVLLIASRERTCACDFIARRIPRSKPTMLCRRSHSLHAANKSGAAAISRASFSSLS